MVISWEHHGNISANTMLLLQVNWHPSGTLVSSWYLIPATLP